MLVAFTRWQGSSDLKCIQRLKDYSKDALGIPLTVVEPGDGYSYLSFAREVESLDEVIDQLAKIQEQWNAIWRYDAEHKNARYMRPKGCSQFLDYLGYIRWLERDRVALLLEESRVVKAS